MLIAANIIHYLCERGWLSPARVVAGDVVVRVRVRRHTSFAIEHRDASGLFAKQQHQWHPETIVGSTREIGFYRALAGGAAPDLRDVVPAFVGFDAAEQLLVLEHVGAALVDGAEDRACTAELAAAVGAALARVHALEAARAGELLDSPVLAPPWAFSLARELRARSSPMPGAAAALAPVIADHPGLVACIEQLAGAWRRRCLIHGDLKWENVLVRPDGRPALVDWESATIGDPAWDAAYFLAAGLARVLLRRPTGTGLTHDDAAAGQSARRAFWSAWTEARGLSKWERDNEASRVAAYVAVRFVHAAYEHAAVSSMLQSGIVAMIVSAWDMLRAPERAIDLIGVGAT